MKPETLPREPLANHACSRVGETGTQAAGIEGRGVKRRRREEKREREGEESKQGNHFHALVPGMREETGMRSSANERQRIGEELRETSASLAREAREE